MAELQAHLLGPFRVYLDERLLEGGAWRSQQVRTILKILLVRRGRVVTADQLIEQLWPDEDPETARRHLHVRISQLRRILDPDRRSPVVLTVGDGYTLDPSSCRVDAAEFEGLAEQARGAMEDGRWAPAIEAYEAAHALYRGDLLEEDLYQDWVYGERERLRERHLMVLTELAECYAQQGRYRRAIACCHQVLAADRCREVAHVRLMLYHYYAGEQAQALRSYERCRHVLAAELGVEPLPATAELAEQIRAGTLWSHEGAPRYPPPAYEGRLFEVPYSLGHAPLVGRRREYAWLIERWRALGVGALLLEGEAGVGKTRLADEFLGYATRTGATVLRLRAASGSDLPYAGVAHALRRLPELWGVPLPSTTLAALAPFFPEVHDRYPSLPVLPQLTAEEERERTLAALERLAQGCCGPGTILFVDDCHRAGADSLALLARLARHLTLLVTCRSEETPPDHPLRAALRPLRRDGLLASLRLQPLPLKAVRSLIRELAQGDLPVLADRLASETGGNPLFLTAALQHLFEEGALYVDASGAWAPADELPAALPATVRQAIQARLQRAGGGRRRVLDVVAVAGGALDMALLQRASAMPEDELLEAVDGLLEAGLLVEPRALGREDLALAHDCYAEVAYDTLPGLRRRQLHRRVAEALAATAPDADAVAPAVARHYEEAGDGPHAFDWLIRAGRAAEARYAHEAALGFYERAVRQGAGETADVYERMGRIAHHLARYDDGVHYGELALARFQALQDAAREGAVRYSLAECLRESSRYREAADQARRGLEMATARQDPSALARGHIILSNALRSGQLAPADTVRAHLEEALDLARPLGEWQLVGEATFWLGVVAINRGDAQVALEHDREALDCFRRTGQTGWEAMALNNMAYHALLAGRASLGLETAETGLALAREIGSLNDQGWLLSTLGEVQTHLGRLGEARRTLEEGLALVSRWGPPRLRPGLLADLARVAIAQQEWQRALAHLAEALATAPRDAPQFVPRLRTYLAEALLGSGDLAAAESEAVQAQEGSRQKGQRGVEGRAWRVLGRIGAASARVAEAEEAFARSLALLEEVGDGLEAARTRHAWARWLAQRGDARAEGWLAEARAAFGRAEAALDLEEAGMP